MVLLDGGELVALLRRLEWSQCAYAPRVGQKEAPMFRACPVCDGIQLPTDDHAGDFFPRHMLGHRDDCAFHQILWKLGQLPKPTEGQ